MNNSYWIESSLHKTYDYLKENIATDVLIVGGGMVGVTTAYLLAKEGIGSVLVDANKIGHASSGRNTGKVTCQHGIIYSKINNKYGFEESKLYYEGNKEALDLISSIIIENNIDCDFKIQDSYIFAQNENYIEELKEEYKVCENIGIQCEYHEKLDFDLNIKGAISFKNQASFNPKKYIDGLTKECIRLGVKIYENTPIIDIKKNNEYILKTNRDFFIKTKKLILSTQVPFYDGGNFYFAKEKADKSYLIGATVNKTLFEGMYVGVEERGITFRIHKSNNETLLIFGGGDHKVGKHNNEEHIYSYLESYMSEKFDINEIKYRWSAQDYMSYDNLPYIGQINKKEDSVYIATGFSKWGMTNATLSAIIISDMISNIENRYIDLFNPSRKGSYTTYEFYKENLDVGIEYIKGKIIPNSSDLPKAKGEGKIVTIDSKRYGAYKDYDGKIHIVDITCTHLGCELKFNNDEKTWDCPCHASRFDVDGNILQGPALIPLKKYGEGKNDIDPKL